MGQTGMQTLMRLSPDDYPAPGYACKISETVVNYRVSL